MESFDVLQKVALESFLESTQLDLDEINISLFYPSWKYRKSFEEIKKRTKKRAELIEKFPIMDYREIGGYYLVFRDGKFSTLLETEGERIRGRMIAGIPKFYASDGKPLLKKVKSLRSLDNITYIVDMHSHPFTFVPSDNDISFAINNLDICPSGLEYIEGIYGYSGKFLLIKISKKITPNISLFQDGVQK